MRPFRQLMWIDESMEIANAATAENIRIALETEDDGDENRF